MTKRKIQILIVSIPGIFQRMLARSIAARPEVGVVTHASGGLSACSALKEHSLDLVLIDSNVPGNEVIELLDIMQADYPDLPYQVFRDTSREVQELISSGIDQVNKTYDLNQNLDDLLDDFLARMK